MNALTLGRGWSPPHVLWVNFFGTRASTEALAALDTGRQIAPFCSRLAAFELDDAYRVTAAANHMRVSPGETWTTDLVGVGLAGIGVRFA